MYLRILPIEALKPHGLIPREMEDSRPPATASISEDTTTRKSFDLFAHKLHSPAGDLHKTSNGPDHATVKEAQGNERPYYSLSILRTTFLSIARQAGRPD